MGNDPGNCPGSLHHCCGTLPPDHHRKCNRPVYQWLLSSVCRSRRFRFGRYKLERSCIVARPGSIHGGLCFLLSDFSLEGSLLHGRKSHPLWMYCTAKCRYICFKSYVREGAQKLTSNDLKVLRQNDFKGILKAGILFLLLLLADFSWTLPTPGFCRRWASRLCTNCVKKHLHIYTACHFLFQYNTGWKARNTCI